MISKTVANRLQKVLDLCIDKVQSAFVPRCLIADNLDMSKAYDRVEWSFLKRIMEAGGVFRLTNGLHQWDSLSPYLFLLCSEGLSSLMRLALEEGLLKRVKV
ncbi:reverse transcriptase [Gossypium australe]|uniref:Reverse transcriptase n=1 Tax=Gossypium australe TaxID=47621 RepID=A0A5B6W0M1_9ROSI|nr:reverse transcriptase [Gossypium australe]